MTVVTGTSSIVFTDLVGSTALRSQLGEAAADRLQHHHDAALADVVAAHRGRVVKRSGDGLMASFESASEAVAAAVAMHQAIERLGRQRRLDLRLRLGISAGDVSSRLDQLRTTRKRRYRPMSDTPPEDFDGCPA